jgi:endonuclease III
VAGDHQRDLRRDGERIELTTAPTPRDLRTGAVRRRSGSPAAAGRYTMAEVLGFEQGRLVFEFFRASRRTIRIPRPSSNMEPYHAARRGRTVGAGDRCRRQQGDAPPVRRGQTRPNRWSRSARKAQEHIKTIGLFNTKAKNVIALSEKLIRDHGGEVPADRDALETLPGVGRKTANVVLNTAFGHETFAVDTHIFRVGNRTGLARGKTWLAVELKLEKVVPQPFRLHAHHWLILHGRYVCKARTPECWRCIVADLCAFKPKTPAPSRRNRDRRQAEAHPARNARRRPVSCISTPQIRNTRVRDDSTIDFYMTGGKTYRNTLPYKCSGLGFQQAFSYSTSIARLCSVDIITVQGAGPIRGATCGLGQFQPVTGLPR